jgi:Flp pilus assembly protein TadD
VGGACFLQRSRVFTGARVRDAEAWLGLAASYDRLRRFDLADRAYAQAIGILGPKTEILNNQGYSYMLRGNFKRAREASASATAESEQPVRSKQSAAAGRQRAQGKSIE